MHAARDPRAARVIRVHPGASVTNLELVQLELEGRARATAAARGLEKFRGEWVAYHAGLWRVWFISKLGRFLAAADQMCKTG